MRPDAEATVTAAHAAGYDLVPVGAGTKVSRTRWDRRDFSLGELLAHVRAGGNVAAKVGATRSGVRAVVVDRDSRSQATWDFVRTHRLMRSTMQVETASGNWHLWFRLGQEAGDVRSRIKVAVRVGGTRLPVDLKATGYVLMPPSRIGGTAYRFRDGKGLKRPEDLALLPASVVGLLNEARAGGPTAQPRPACRPVEGIDRVRRYVRRAFAVSGAGGHNTTFRVACRLADAGLTQDQILGELLDWNETNAAPKWSEAELRHKAADAVRRPTRAK